MKQNTENKTPEKPVVNAGKDASCSQALFWWVMLVAAVIAIPAGGVFVATALPVNGLVQIVAFIIGCWLCTWVGMWLMKNSHKFEK